MDGGGDAHRGRGASAGAFAVRERALEHRLLLHQLFLEFQEVSLLRGGPRGAAAGPILAENLPLKGKTPFRATRAPARRGGRKRQWVRFAPPRRVPTVVDPPRTPDATLRRVPRSFATLGAAETARAGRRPSPGARAARRMISREVRATLWAFTLASKWRFPKPSPCVTEFASVAARFIEWFSTVPEPSPRIRHPRVRARICSRATHIGHGSCPLRFPRVGQSVPRGVVSREAKMPVGRLEVHVVDAVRLQDTQMFGRQDPSCGCGAARSNKDRTKTHTDGGVSPRWHRALRVQPRRVRDRARHRGVEQQHADREQHHRHGLHPSWTRCSRVVSTTRGCRLKDKKDASARARSPSSCGSSGRGPGPRTAADDASAADDAPPQMMPPQQMMPSPGTVVSTTAPMGVLCPPRLLLPDTGTHPIPRRRTATRPIPRRRTATPLIRTARRCLHLPAGTADTAHRPGTPRRSRPPVRAGPTPLPPRTTDGFAIDSTTRREKERARRREDRIRMSALHVKHARVSRAPRSFLASPSLARARRRIRLATRRRISRGAVRRAS